MLGLRGDIGARRTDEDFEVAHEFEIGLAQVFPGLQDICLLLSGTDAAIYLLEEIGCSGVKVGSAVLAEELAIVFSTVCRIERTQDLTAGFQSGRTR